MAGLFHDLGYLVLAANLPDRLKSVVVSATAGKGMLEAENEEFGATHAEVGAYLLGIWGFPDPLLEAALFHHQPSRSCVESFTSLTAVHLANAFAHEVEPPEGRIAGPAIDADTLARLKVGPEKVEEWRRMAAALAGEARSE